MPNWVVEPQSGRTLIMSNLPAQLLPCQLRDRPRWLIETGLKLVWISNLTSLHLLLRWKCAWASQSFKKLETRTSFVWKITYSNPKPTPWAPQITFISISLRQHPANKVLILCAPLLVVPWTVGTMRTGASSALFVPEDNVWHTGSAQKVGLLLYLSFSSSLLS